MYLLGNETSNKTRFSTYGNAVDSEWFFLCWTLGRPFERGISTPIIYNQAQVGGGRPGPLSDMLFTKAGQFLVSDRLFRALEPCSSCIRAYASEIHYKGEAISTDYVTINFEASFPCLDWLLSQYTMLADEDLGSLTDHMPGTQSPRDGAMFVDGARISDSRVGRISRLVLDEGRIPGGEGIFRLQESPTYLLANHHMRELVRLNGITGVDLFDLEGDRSLP